MEKTIVHILSHSHWDREWYLPFESHRMRLVELIDDLIELFETDPDFHSFHLDGQTIVLDDYLAIRPEKEGVLRDLIKRGKLKIGPFYILQDDFLISNESNVRNQLIGQAECDKWGGRTAIGYFPDTFGNMGQAPQLLKLGELDVAAFGRGVRPIGFDNHVLDEKQFVSRFSEMNWQSPDGSQVLGILFANWYSNGNEIPTDPQEAKEFWDQKLEQVGLYASTNQWLMMNGCDHQPVQKNLTEAIRVANQLYPDFEFVHSSFDDYMGAVLESLPQELTTVTGELTSQETDGWYTLANTASARIYLKQAYHQAASLLEQGVESLVVMTKQAYPKDQLTYAWKLLLQNAPHDSICGCSDDAVHREMETRLEKVQQVGHYLQEEILNSWAQELNRPEPHSFTVVNSSLFDQQQLVTLELDLATCSFKEAHPRVAYEKMAALAIGDYHLEDPSGHTIPLKVQDLGAIFDYDLPKDAFRQAYIGRRLRLTFSTSLEALSWTSLYLKEGRGKETNGLYQDGRIETAFYELECLSDRIQLRDKASGRVFDNLLRFEDRGDIGNEYIYFQPPGTSPIYAKQISHKVLFNSDQWVELEVVHELEIPLSADERLLEEQKGLVEFKDRKAGRSKDLIKMELVSRLTLFADGRQIHCQTRFKNAALDHRIRLLFDTGQVSESHLADSIFEVVERPNVVGADWENPENPQHQRTFVHLNGLTISNRGLQEYEILDERTIAIPILRAVGELGDWGVFPTPEAQCLRDCVVDFAIEVAEEPYGSFKRAHAFQVPLLATAKGGQGDQPANGRAKRHSAFEDDRLCPTALKQSEKGHHDLIRYFNMTDQAVKVRPKKTYNILEESLGLSSRVGAHEIRTEDY